MLLVKPARQMLLVRTALAVVKDRRWARAFPLPPEQQKGLGHGFLGGGALVAQISTMNATINTNA